MKLVHFFLVLVLAAFIGAGSAWVTTANLALSPIVTAQHESAYARVLRTGTLRCGYLLYPHMLIKDPNTGEMSGPLVDIVNEIGRQTSLKVEWTEQVSFATAFEGLKTGRYDAVCFHTMPTPGRARVALFSIPFLFSPWNAYVRADDKRFDNALPSLNRPEVRFVTIDGEFSQIVRSQDYPNSTNVSLPSLTDVAEGFLDVAHNKADVVTGQPAYARAFDQNNPGQIRQVQGPPLRMLAGALSVASGEHDLKALLDTTLTTLQGTGFIERTLRRALPEPGMFLVPTTPWRAEGL